MTYSDFETRWKPAGGAERANYGLFLQDLCDLIGVPRLNLESIVLVYQRIRVNK